MAFTGVLAAEQEVRKGERGCTWVFDWTSSPGRVAWGLWGGGEVLGAQPCMDLQAEGGHTPGTLCPDTRPGAVSFAASDCSENSVSSKPALMKREEQHSCPT